MTRRFRVGTVVRGYRGRRRRYTRRRRVRRRRRMRRGSRIFRMRTHNLIPKRAIYSFKACEDIDISLSAASNNFILTLPTCDMDDPWGTHFTTKLAGFATIAAFYDKYCVISSTVSFRLITQSNNTVAHVVYMWLPLGDAAPASFAAFCADPRSKLAITNSHVTPANRKTSMSFNKIVGHKIEHDNYTEITNNPAEGMVFHARIQRVALTHNPDPINLHLSLHILANVLFIEPVIITL